MESTPPAPSQFRSSVGALSKRATALFGRYGAGTLEQVVIALLNFGIVSASGKILPPTAFAVFVVIMAALTLAFALGSAFISAPVLVLYRKRYDTGSHDYLTKLEWMNLGACLPVSLASLGIARIFEPNITFTDTACGFLALYAWSSYELRRKTAFALGEIRRLLPCSGLVLLTNFVGVATLLIVRRTSESAMLLVLAASYGAGIALFQLACRPSPGTSSYSWKVIAADHWGFGGSLVASILFYWIALQGYFMLGARHLSPEDMGGARTAQNLAGLIAMCVLMFENHSTPEAARIEHRDGKEAVHQYIRRIYRKLSLPFLGLVLAAAVAGFILHRILYREHYAAYSSLVFLFAFHQFLAGASRPYAVGLKAIEYTKPIFWGYFFPALVMLLAGWWIVREFHASGIGIGFSLSALVTLVVLRRGFNQLAS